MPNGTRRRRIKSADAGRKPRGVLAGLPQQVWAENHRYHHTTNGNWAKYRGPLNVACVTDYHSR